MKRLIRPAIEWVVRRAFRVDVYADAFEKIAIQDKKSRLRPLFQHKVPDELRRHPLLFIHVPKNGGTSIKRSLYAFDPGHATIRYYDWLSPSLRKSTTSFAVIRDPVDRFLSGFDFLMNGGGSEVSIQPAALRRLARVQTVDHYLAYLESLAGDWLKVDSFARPQWWYVANRTGAVAVDHLWVIGEQNRHIDGLLAGHGFPSFGHANRTRRESRPLTRGQRARVEQLYRSDFELHEAVLRVPGAGKAGLGHIIVPQV